MRLKTVGAEGNTDAQKEKSKKEKRRKEENTLLAERLGAPRDARYRSRRDKKLNPKP